MDELWLTYAVSVSLLAAMILLPPVASGLPASAALAAALAVSAAAVLLPAKALGRAGLTSKGLERSDLEYLASADLIRALLVVDPSQVG